MKYYVYILRSNLDGRLYKGMTSDIKKRILEHNSGKTKSTKGFRPWKLVYSEEFDSFELARKRELFFKSGEGRELIKRVIKEAP